MGGFLDVMAWQGTGMADRPEDIKTTNRVKDVWLRTIEYRIVDTLLSDGFDRESISLILQAVMPSLKDGVRLSPDMLGDRLRGVNLPPDMLKAITNSVAAAAAQR